ncbi:hypothetical protein [uncultured Roseovarius sp.]|uniref:hypothetical protein n=1 Tax=uncultured Roseovarius sp. TaxID=293344 RepID=UPI00262F0E77|nr:hypothetical protein [uncultured Roseovarius sp.]
MKYRLWQSLLALLISLSPAQAQMFEICDGGPAGAALEEGAAQFGRSFANGKVTIFNVYVDQNLRNGVLLAVLHPQPGDLAGAGYFQGCTAVYRDDGGPAYFGQVFIDRAEASYDPATGLTITVPVRNILAGKWVEDAVVMVVNQETGWIGVK